jgi:ATP-dependent RNA helicase HelY
VLGTIELPLPFAPGRPEFMREVAERLARVKVTTTSRTEERRSTRERHAVEADPELEDRLKTAAQADRVEREIADLRTRVGARTRSIARQFDRLLGLLERRDYVRGWQLSERGTVLARIFHECDLLLAECLHGGLLDGLDAPALAGLVSVFTYEHRSSEDPPTPWFPSRAVRQRFATIASISAELRAEEEALGMAPHRSPDPTFFAVAYAWAAGEGFADVVEDEELSGGDFVRNVKQLIDLLRQLALVAPLESTRSSADAAAQALFRGVVSASSAVPTPRAATVVAVGEAEGSLDP